jgi:hypothetical protein
MASLITYTKASFIERIKRHISNGYPSGDFSLSDNEILLMVDTALPYAMIGQVYNNAKLEGSLVVPEAYYSTFSLSQLTQDKATRYWYASLPQPPVSLPLGHSISRVYFANGIDGEGDEVLPIKAKRVGIRKMMPLPSGARYWVEGSRIWIAASNGAPLNEETCYVQMIQTRSTSLSDALDVPDDVLQVVFDAVVKQCLQRLGVPQDIVRDDLPAGTKTS